MSAEVIELRSAGGVSGACFGINSYESKRFFEELLDVEKKGGCVQGNVETRATRATHAQHWLDALLDDRPVITPTAPTDAAPTPPGPKRWRVTPIGRPAFYVICVQGATAEMMHAQWPGAEVEPQS